MSLCPCFWTKFEIFFLSRMTVLSHWDISRGKFRPLSPGKASSNNVALLNLWCMLGILSFHNSPTSDMDYRIFDMRMWPFGMRTLDLDLQSHLRDFCGGMESAQKFDSGQLVHKISLAQNRHPCDGHIRSCLTMAFESKQSHCALLTPFCIPFTAFWCALSFQTKSQSFCSAFQCWLIDILSTTARVQKFQILFSAIWMFWCITFLVHSMPQCVTFLQNT